MAINPEEIDVTTVDKLDDLNLALGNFFAHTTLNGKLGKATLDQLATFLAPYITAVGGSGFIATTGTVLPAASAGKFTIVGAGTYTQANGGNVVVTEMLNVLGSSATTWSLVVAVPLPQNIALRSDQQYQIINGAWDLGVDSAGTLKTGYYDRATGEFIVGGNWRSTERLSVTKNSIVKRVGSATTAGLTSGTPIAAWDVNGVYLGGFELMPAEFSVVIKDIYPTATQVGITSISALPPKVYIKTLIPEKSLERIENKLDESLMEYVGKNKFDIRNVKKGLRIDDQTGLTYLQGGAVLSDIMPAKQGDVHIKNITAVNSLRYLDVNGIPLKPLKTDGTEFPTYNSGQNAFMAPAGTVGFQVQLSTATAQIDYANTQVEIGASRTPFEKYTRKWNKDQVVGLEGEFTQTGGSLKTAKQIDDDVVLLSDQVGLKVAKTDIIDNSTTGGIDKVVSAEEAKRISTRVDQANNTAISAQGGVSSALTKATEAKQQSTVAEQKADSTQSQFNEIQANANTSNVEVSGARVSSLKTFASLGARLDDNDDRSPVYVSSFGVSPLNTAAVNTPLFQEAADYAQARNKRLELPYTAGSDVVLIDKAIDISTSGIKITGSGKQSRIRQTIFPNPIFDVYGGGKGTVLDGFSASCTSFNGAGFTSVFRGNLLQSYSAAVVIFTDNVTVRNVTVDNMTSGVLCAAWDVPNDILRTSLRGIVVEHLTVSNVNMGLLVKGVEDFYLSNINGSYRLLPGIPTPPHLIYFVASENENKNVSGGNCLAWDGEYSTPYQLKGLNGGSLIGLNARNCMRTINIMESKNFTVTGVSHVDDANDDPQIGSCSIDGVCENVNIYDINISMKADGKPILFGATPKNCKMVNIYVETNHTTASPLNCYDVDLNGVNNTVENVQVINKGTTHRTASIGIFGGTNNSVISPKTDGNQRGIVIRTGTRHSVFDYKLEDLKSATGYVHSQPITSLVPVTLIPRSDKQGISSANRLLAFDKFDVFNVNSTGLLGMAITSSGKLWTALNETIWRLSDNRAFSATGTGALAYIDVATNNIDLSAGIKLKDKEGLAFRIIDNTNFLLARINQSNNKVELYKFASGSALLAEKQMARLPIGKRFRLRVVAYGDFIEVFLDGQSVITHTLSAEDTITFGTSTFHGIRTSTSVSGLFDNAEWMSVD